MAVATRNFGLGGLVYLALLTIAVVLDTGSVCLSMRQGSAELSLVFKPALDAVLFYALWRGIKAARVFLAALSVLGVAIGVLIGMQNPLALYLAAMMGLQLALLLFSRALGHFMEQQRARPASTRQSASL